MLALAAVVAAAVLYPRPLPAADNLTDDIAAVRSTYTADRQVFLAENMQLTEGESTAFWPLYRQYRAEQEKVGDGLVKLVLEYADLYPNVPEDRARQLFRDYNALEKKLASTRAWYLKKFARILPPSKALRFAQLENRLDLALRLQLASGIPLTPIEGRLNAESTRSVALSPGMPGGTVVQTSELTATVASVEPASRKLTLLGSDGIKQTIKVGPAAINFDQIKVGDRLRLTVAEELVVYVAGEGETPSDAAAQLVALAPKGAKPGGIVADTIQVTAKVTAIDLEHRKATLQFEDGSTRTVAVRSDVDLGKRRVGDRVVVRTTEALAIQVSNP